MKKAPFFFKIFASLLMLAACSDTGNYRVSEYLNEQESEAFKHSIIRYVAPLPKRGNHDNKFESRFDNHYQEQLGKISLDKYYRAPDGFIYFEVSRIAPSFKIKRVATAGRLKFDDSGTLSSYEEIYRTWKMEEQELNEKTRLLFSKLVTNQDLTPFYTANSEEEYIEFPDQTVRYDTVGRRWVNEGLLLQTSR